MTAPIPSLLRTRPLVALTISFMAGLAAAAELGLSPWLAIPIFGAGIALLIVRPAWALAGIALIGATLGVLRYQTFVARPASDISHLVSPAPVTVYGTVASDPELRPGRMTFLLAARRVDTREGYVDVTGTTYATLSTYARNTAPSISDGDSLTLDGILEEPETATNPGGFSWRDYLARRAVWCELHVKRPNAVRETDRRGVGSWSSLAWHARNALLSSMRAGLSPADSAVLSGILLGRRIELPPALMADFVATGTVHILATAGLHVGIVSLLLMALFSRITFPRKLSAALMIGTVWIYALMAGGRPSVTRAAVMASIYFGAVLFERAPDLLTSLAAAALFVLWAQPTAIVEPAFQMSFATVLGLIVLMPIWTDLTHGGIAKIKGRWPRNGARWLWELAGLSLISQLAATPVVAAAYNQVSLLGFFANLCVVPALFLLLPAGFIAALIGCLSRAAGDVLFHWVVAPVLHYIVATVTFFAHLPGCSLSVAALPPLVIFAYYSVLFGAAVWLKARADRVNTARSSQAEEELAAPSPELAEAASE